MSSEQYELTILTLDLSFIDSQFDFEKLCDKCEEINRES